MQYQICLVPFKRVFIYLIFICCNSVHFYFEILSHIGARRRFFIIGNWRWRIFHIIRSSFVLLIAYRTVIWLNLFKTWQHRLPVVCLVFLRQSCLFWLQHTILQVKLGFLFEQLLWLIAHLWSVTEDCVIWLCFLLMWIQLWYLSWLKGCEVVFRLFMHQFGLHLILVLLPHLFQSYLDYWGDDTLRC